mmetsp:Transcript_78859/g.229028  ORF Transcript_78859/g.229028 Transcript_78859/m.229028 type:complete len:268 (+) Transcript_78859:278-1081(+)
MGRGELHEHPVGALRAQDAALLPVELRRRQRVRLDDSARGEVLLVDSRLLQQRLDLVLPLAAECGEDVVVPPARPHLQLLLPASKLLMAHRCLLNGDDLILVAMHNQGRAGHSLQLADGVEGLLQHLEHLRVLGKEHRRHHLHGGKHLNRHQARVYDEAMELSCVARCEVHRACRADGPAMRDALRGVDARVGQHLATREEALVSVGAELRQARVAGTPSIAPVVDGEQRCTVAMQHVGDIIHGGADLRVAMEKVHHCAGFAPGWHV